MQAEAAQNEQAATLAREHSMVLFGYNIDTMGIVFLFLVALIILFPLIIRVSIGDTQAVKYAPRITSLSIPLRV